jgi:hypothetical protein
MTTGNKIITKTINDVVYIPLESVQAGADSIPFVFLKNGSRQIVVLGESNENNVIAEQGLEEGTQIYLNSPEEPEKFSKILGEELKQVIKEKEKAKKEAEKQASTAGRNNFGGGGSMGTPGMGGQFPGMNGASMQGGQGRTMDTAAMSKMRKLRDAAQKGDTAAIRQMQQMRGNMPRGGFNPADGAAQGQRPVRTEQPTESR